MEEAERFLVELRRPGLGWSELDAVAARARQAAGELTRAGRPVQFLRSVYVPEDGSCFFLYEGRSAADVRSAAERVGVTVERVVETLRAESDAGFVETARNGEPELPEPLAGRHASEDELSSSSRSGSPRRVAAEDDGRKDSSDDEIASRDTRDRHQAAGGQ